MVDEKNIRRMLSEMASTMEDRSAELIGAAESALPQTIYNIIQSMRTSLDVMEEYATTLYDMADTPED